MARGRREDLIECGMVGRAVGLKGFVAVNFYSGVNPVEVGGELFFLNAGNEYKPNRVTALRKQGRFYVLGFDGTTDRESAKKLGGTKLFIEMKTLPKLPKGEYYSHEIMGLDVVTEDGEDLGKVTKIFTVGENDVYEVKKGDKEVLIPAIDNVVISIDLAAGRIVVRPLEGMLD